MVDSTVLDFKGLAGPMPLPAGATLEQSSGIRKYGHIRNFKVIWEPHYLRLSGSLGKFLKGENISPMTWEMSCEAITELERLCGFPVDEAEIRQIEIGQTIVVDDPPWGYLQVFGKPNHFDRVIINTETVLIKNRERSFQVYNKTREATKKHISIPPSYQGQNLVRLEWKHKKVRGLHLGDLKNPVVQRELSKQFLSFYESIPKLRAKPIALPENYRDLRLIAMGSFIRSSGGIEDFLDAVSSTPWERWQKDSVKKSAKNAIYGQHLDIPDYETELTAKLRKAIDESFILTEPFHESKPGENPGNEEKIV